MTDTQKRAALSALHAHMAVAGVPARPIKGGKREGAGRPSSGLTERVNIRVTPEEKAELERLGGSEWIREQIQRAMCVGLHKSTG